MADPVWTAQYSLNQTPEANGFTRELYGTPSILEQTGGTPANRRLEINSNNGGAVFVTSSVPSLNDQVGATVEMIVQVSGVGDAGYELTFLNRYIGVCVYQNKMTVVVPDGEGVHSFDTTDNSGQTTVRMTYQNGNMSLYRNAVLVATLPVPSEAKPFNRVLFWAEGGGVQIYRAMRYYLGGAVAP